MAAQEVMLRVSITHPDRVDLAKIQHSFQELGFRVEADGRRGFLLFGPIEKIESTFRTKVSRQGDNLSLSKEPEEETILKEIQFRAYFPRKPAFF